MINPNAPRDVVAKLKTVQHKTVWGARNYGLNRSNIVTMRDQEYLIPIGSGLLHIENVSIHTRKIILVTSGYPEVIKINMMKLSPDREYLATTVTMQKHSKSDIHIMIFHTKGHMSSAIRPRHLKYSTNAFIAAGDRLICTAFDFSHDSMYLACATNFPSIGAIIFDQLKGTVFQTIATDGIPHCISFHPADSGKLFVTGSSNFVKFWRFTGKSVHVAPIVGLRRGNYHYTNHAWIPPYNENTLVTGTTQGFVSVIQNCEQRAPSSQAFGSAEFSDPQYHSISQLLVRGDNVIVASPKNQIVLYEIRRVVLSKGVGLTATLVPLAYYKLENVNCIYGLDFCLNASVTSYTLIATTDNSVIQLEMISDHDLSGGNENKTRRMSQDSGDAENDHVWTLVDSEKSIYKFHSGNVQSLSVSTKGRVFMSASFHDTTVRMWDFEDPQTFQSSWMIESFNDRAEENPFHVDLHPSGLQIATACESEVREYAVSDSQLDLIRRFGVRTPFQSPTGQPVVISQPVSIVKYSHGGHLLAVVTGKTVQIFHIFRQDNETASSVGSPCRVMTMCDHVATITDIAFSRDDSRIFTISNDGSVYSWILGATGREKEYVCKGIAATHLAVTTNNPDKTTILVAFEGQAETVNNLAADIVRQRRQSSIAMRSQPMSRGASTPSFQPRSRNASGQDFAAALPFMENGDTNNSASNKNSGSNDNINVGSSPNSKPPPAYSKNNFIAIWEDEIHSNPVIAHIEIPIRALAVGKSCGPDSNNLCVIGLVDGRVLVSLLPIPLFQIAPNPPKTTIHSTIAVTKVTGALKLRRKNTMQSLMDTVAEGSLGELSSPAESHHSHNTHFTPTKNNSSNSIASEAPEPMAPFSPSKSYSALHEEPASPSPAASRSEAKVFLDENQCKIFRLFVGSVTRVAFSMDGQYIFVAGDDGSIHVLTTVKKVNDDLVKQQQTQDIPVNSITQFLMMEKTKMQLLRSKLIELETTMEQGRKENEMYINKLLEGKERQYLEMETKLKKEIQKREDTIVAGRKEYLQMKRSMQDEINQLNKASQDALNAMELMYEKKLAQEAVYLDKMKQAYDEFVVHSRMDMSNLQVEAEAKIRQIEVDKAKALQEAEKQKVAVLKYYDYVKARNDEVLQSLEEQQAEERTKLKTQLKESNTLLAQSQAQTMTGEVQASRTIRKLKVDIETKEMEVMRVNSDIDWANERIQKLENALEKATGELKARSELTEKWEMKTIELSKKLEDLEKIRKTLTIQLNAVQGELTPKEIELQKATDKLQEMTREYEIALHAITEKEMTLSQRAESLQLLQKQVRELRATAAQKDAALRRAAMSLDEFVYAMNESKFKPLEGSSNDIFKVAEQRMYGKMDKKGNQLQNSNNGNGNTSNANGNATVDPNNVGNQTSTNNNGNNNSSGNQQEKSNNQEKNKPPSPKLRKKPSPADGLLAALNLDPGSDHKLKRLHDILKPYMVEGGADTEYIDEMEAVRREQERHVSILHRNVQNLLSSMDSVQEAANAKVVNHLTDNQTLLMEVNNLRTEIKALSLENHRLSALMEYQNSRKAIEAHNANSLVLNSEIDERYVLLEKAGTTTTTTSRKSKRAPTYHQTKSAGQDRGSSPETFNNPTPHLSYPPNNTLPKLNNTATSSSLNNLQDALATTKIPTVSKPPKKTPAKNATPSIDELLGSSIPSGGSMVKSSSDFLWKSKNNNMFSNTAPLASPATNNNNNNNSSSNNSQEAKNYSSAAERKIAAIVELNLQELHAGKKSKTSSY